MTVDRITIFIILHIIDQLSISHIANSKFQISKYPLFELQFLVSDGNSIYVARAISGFSKATLILFDIISIELSFSDQRKFQNLLLKYPEMSSVDLTTGSSPHPFHSID